MPYTEKKNLRVVKTQRSLIVAMSSLLERHKFKRITVRDICEEAQVSRATFYSYYIDKFDLLKHWLTHFVSDNIGKYDTYAQWAESVGKFVNNYKKTIKNLIDDADSETLALLFEFIASSFQVTIEENAMINPGYVVLSNFYAGGMLHYLTWQVKNNFPPEVSMINIHLYELLKKFDEFGSEIGKPSMFSDKE